MMIGWGGGWEIGRTWVVVFFFFLCVLGFCGWCGALLVLFRGVCRGLFVCWVGGICVSLGWCVGVGFCCCVVHAVGFVWGWGCSVGVALFNCLSVFEWGWFVVNEWVVCWGYVE